MKDEEMRSSAVIRQERITPPREDQIAYRARFILHPSCFPSPSTPL